jgi:ABC-type multidrug transport system ATPase subunit
VEKSATRLGVLHEGRIRFEGSPVEMARASTRERPLHLRVSAVARAARVLGMTATGLPSGPGTLAVMVQEDAQAAEALRQVVSAGVEVFEATREAASLESGFLALLRGESVAG